MAIEITYDNIDRPYSSFLERSEQDNSAGSNAWEATQDEGWRTIKTGSSLNDAWIDTWIKSTGYIPKKRGFLLDWQAWYIECMKLFVGGWGIVGWSLDIPDTVSTNSFHVDVTWNTWWGATTLAWSVASILNTWAANFTSVSINWVPWTAIATAITIDGDLQSDIINARFDTASKQILDWFTFGYSGAIKMITDSNNGLWISPNWLLWKKSGQTTFSISTTGDAVFAGTLTAASGTLGTITSGNIYGSTIKTSNTTYPAVQIDTNWLNINWQYLALTSDWSTKALLGYNGSYPAIFTYGSFSFEGTGNYYFYKDVHVEQLYTGHCPLWVGSYNFRPVGFTFNQGGTSKTITVLATWDPV